MAITSNGTGGGNFSAGASWAGGVVPALGVADAIIAASDTITIDTTGLGCGTDPGAGVAGLTVNGTLKYSIIADSDLTVRGDIVVENGGVLYDGTLLNAAYGVRKHRLKIDCVNAIGKYKLHVKDGGIFKPYSVLPTPWYTRLSADCASGQAVVKVTDNVQAAGWKVGDLVVIPQCITDGASVTYLQTEVREIASFNSPTEFVVTANLTYTHNKVILTNPKVTWKRDCPVVLLSRDIVIESTNPNYPGYVVNSTVTDMAKWYPKGIEFKELGKSATETALTYRSNPALPVAYTNPSYGSMSGISIHPGLNKKGFPGFLYALYKATALEDHSIAEMVVVGTSIAGAAGSSTYLFAEVHNIVCNLNINRLFIFGGSGSLAVMFGGGSSVGQKLVTITNLEAAGFVYGPILCKVGTASDIHVWGCYYIGIYMTSMNFSCTNLVVLCGYYGITGSSTSMRNLITNLYTRTTTYYALSASIDIEITNWVSDDIVLYNNHPGLIEIRVNDFDMVEDDFFTFTQEGTVYSCKSTFASPRDNVRTAANGAILLEPVSASLALEFEHEVSVEDGKQVVVTGYMYKDAAYNGADEPGVTLNGAGMTTSSMAFDEMVDAGGGWYLWTVSGTPTRTTQAFLTISCIGTAGHIVIADVIVLGADVNTGNFKNFAHGRSARILFAVKLPAADVATAVWEKVITSMVTAGSAAKLLQDAKIETDKIQTIDDNVDAVLTDTGTTLPALIGAIVVDFTPVLTDTGLIKAETNKIQTIDNNVDTCITNILSLLADHITILAEIAALGPGAGAGGGSTMAFTTWAALLTTMRNDLATGSWRVEEYSIGGEYRKKYRSFKEFKEALSYVEHQAAIEAGETTKTYAKNGGRASS